MLDVIVAGAGPAGTVAALVLARAGVRVLIVDRFETPRERLCGDLLNPGAVRLLASLGLDLLTHPAALPVPAMRLTGPSATVDTVYAAATPGLSIPRRTLDAWLLEEAIRAGARFRPGEFVRGALIDESRRPSRVRGVVLASRRGHAETRLPASVVIASDGRRSALARQLGLHIQTSKTGRWGFGGHVSRVQGVSAAAEVHVRRGWCLGMTPLGGGAVSLWVTVPFRPEGRDPADVIRRAVRHDPELAVRLASVEFGGNLVVSGPLAVDARAPGAPGLFLAGDSAGFADPATADGLGLAIDGGRLAAIEGARTLEDGEFVRAVSRLAAARRQSFGRQLRIDRWARRCVETPAAVDAASIGARFFPGVFRAVLRYASDAK